MNVLSPLMFLEKSRTKWGNIGMPEKTKRQPSGLVLTRALMNKRRLNGENVGMAN
jgi:hypothetical protein